MADHTGIEWTDATWNPTVGCSLVSPGCSHCYAMAHAARLERMGVARYAGLTQPTAAGPVWTGEVRLAPDATLHLPLTWRLGRRVFVNSMSDLFHPSVPDAVVMYVWLVMAQCPQHTFQVLTKRSDRMRAWVARWVGLADESQQPFSSRFQLFGEMVKRGPPPPNDAAHTMLDWPQALHGLPAVLPNVWLGASVEDQRRADERVPDLVATPAAVRFLSAEPLLGPVRLHPSWLAGGDQVVHWVIAGGESGARSRPAHPDWVRDLRDACAAAGTAFFFKQWGEWKPQSEMSEPECFDLYGPPSPREPETELRCRFDTVTLRHDARPASGPFDQLSRHHPAMPMFRVGKRRAGDRLDGRQHHAWPASQASFGDKQ